MIYLNTFSDAIIIIILIVFTLLVSAIVIELVSMRHFAKGDKIMFEDSDGFNVIATYVQRKPKSKCEIIIGSEYKIVPKSKISKIK